MQRRRRETHVKSNEMLSAVTHVTAMPPPQHILSRRCSKTSLTDKGNPPPPPPPKSGAKSEPPKLWLAKVAAAAAGSQNGVCLVRRRPS